MNEPKAAPVCPCGQTMRWDADTETWACPMTLDGDGWGRPKKGHAHYYADEDWQRGVAPVLP